MTRWPVILAPRWVKDPLWKAAKAVPSLDLNFARDKALGSLVTFTRASSGTYVDSAGVIQTATNDVPRFDHNPTTGESLGLLVEEQRSNLLTYSGQLDNAAWTKSEASITANSVASPDGAQTADTLVENTTNNEHRVSVSYSAANATAYTASIYVKAAGRTLVRFGFTASGFSAGTRSCFDLSSGTIASSSGGSPSITALRNGWYRLAVTNTTTSAATITVMVQPVADSSNFSYTGDGTSGIYLWGAQLEAGAFPTSYIPTTGATATRSADVASITGTNFSSWYRQDEGTVFLQGIMAPALSRFPSEWSLDDGTANDRIGSYNFTNGYYSTIRKTGEVSTDPALLSITPTSGTVYQKAVAIKSGDYRVAAQGQQAASLNPAFIPSVSVLRIGTNHSGGAVHNSTIRRLTYWPTRLSDTTLQKITQ